MNNEIESYVVPVKDLRRIQKYWGSIILEKDSFIQETLRDLKNMEPAREQGILREDLPPILKQGAYKRLKSFMSQMETLCLYDDIPVQVDPVLFRDAVAILAAMMKENDMNAHKKKRMLKPDRLEKQHREYMGYAEQVELDDDSLKKITRHKKKILAYIDDNKKANHQLQDFKDDIVEAAETIGIKMYSSRVSPDADGNWRPR